MLVDRIDHQFLQLIGKFWRDLAVLQCAVNARNRHFNGGVLGRLEIYMKNGERS